MSSNLNHQLASLGLLLQLQRRVRQADEAELAFILVNETLNLITYRQAQFWTFGMGKEPEIAAVSGVAVPDSKSPYLQWMKDLVRHLRAQPHASKMHSFGPDDSPVELRTEWHNWLPLHGLWAPLQAPGETDQGCLLFFRETAWSEGEGQLLGYLTDAYAQSLALTRMKAGPSPWPILRSSRRRYFVLAVLAAILFWPIRQSVLVDAEVISERPVLVRAPLDGVVKEFYVQPNELVSAGRKLLALDDTELRSKLAVANQVLESVQADYLQKAQKAVSDRDAKAELGILQHKIEQQNAEVSLLQNLLGRVEVYTPTAGIAIFDDPYDWLGRPVSIGEKILSIGDPEHTRLEISLPVNEALDLPRNAEVLFFPNTAPTEAVRAHLSHAGYHASLLPSQIAAYRLKADFESHPGLRIGLKGTSKLFGRRTPFILWVLRRPLGLARQWLSW